MRALRSYSSIYLVADQVKVHRGGGPGNATKYYNETIGYKIVDSILARASVYPLAMSLNEVCQNNHNVIRWWTTLGGAQYQYGTAVSLGMTPSGRLGNTSPATACGTWYGNTIMVRGGTSSESPQSAHYVPQQPGGYEEQRNWLCLRASSFTRFYCTTHLATDSDWSTQQSAHYRNVSLFVSTNGVIAAGDFNLTHNELPGFFQIIGWQNASFGAADIGRPTLRSGSGQVDYIWFRGGTWSHPPYIFVSAHSDHRWVQGYL